MRHSPLLVASLAIVLTGCGGGTEDVADGPSPTPSPTTSVPTTPAPSATISTPPAHETAEQFIRRWVQVNTEAQRTGDLTALDSLNQPGCDSCKSFDKLVSRIYDAGGVVEPATTEILSLERHRDRNYYSRERSSPSRYTESQSGGWKHLTGGTTTVIYTLAKRGTAWRMADYADLAGSTE